jgi:hypothetical protein
MQHVVEAAGRAGSASQGVLSGAASIGQEAEKLRAEVGHFLTAIRAEAA